MVFCYSITLQRKATWFEAYGQNKVGKIKLLCTLQCLFPCINLVQWTCYWKRWKERHLVWTIRFRILDHSIKINKFVEHWILYAFKPENYTSCLTSTGRGTVCEESSEKHNEPQWWITFTIAQASEALLYSIFLWRLIFNMIQRVQPQHTSDQ